MPEAPEKLWLQWSQATRHWIDCDPDDIYSSDAVAYVRVDEAASEGSGAASIEPVKRIAAMIDQLRKYEEGEAGPAAQGDPGARAIVQFAQYTRERLEEPLPGTSGDDKATALTDSTDDQQEGAG